MSRRSFPLLDARPLPTMACCASHDNISRPKLFADGGASGGRTPRPVPLGRAEGGGGLSTRVALAMAASILSVVDLAMAADNALLLRYCQLEDFFFF